MRQILDFKDISRLRDSIIAERIENGIIITATRALSDALNQFYSEYKCIDVHTLFNNMIPERKKNKNGLQNYIFMRNTLDDYIQEQCFEEKNFYGFVRNATDMWNAINLLVEADVYPDDIPKNVAEPIKHFKNIWERLEVGTNGIMSFRSQFQFRLSNPDNVAEGIELAFSDDGKKSIENISAVKDIFLLGFYYITPIQDRLFDVLEDAGYNIYYLNNRDSKAKFVNEIWQQSFSDEFVAYQSTDIQPNIKQNNLFENVINGQKSVNGVEVRRYASDLEFAQALEGPLKNRELIYTADSNGFDRIINEYYPQFLEKKHLLSYSVGQYVYYLHMMWNPLVKQPELKFDYVYKCFASGWLCTNNLNGKDYLYQLKSIEVFFKDCATTEDWSDRIRQLKEAKQKLSVFDVAHNENQRWHDLLGNPFNNISAYRLSEEQLNDLQILINKLINDEEFLFKETGKTNLLKHFRNIAKLINDALKNGNIDDVEKGIADEFIEHLGQAGLNDVECPLSAVKDAIVLLVGSHKEEADIGEDNLVTLEDNIQSLTMVESSLLPDPKFSSKDIHLVLADEFTMPGIPVKLPWPLNSDLLKMLGAKFAKESGRGRSRRYVARMDTVATCRPLAMRYLFACLLSNLSEDGNRKLHISWIKKRGNNIVGASPYTLLVQAKANSIKDTANKIDFKKAIEDKKVVLKSSSIVKPSTILPKMVDDAIEVCLDYKLCEYRYLYSYILNYLPCYTSEFHYSFLFSNLVGAFYNVASANNKGIGKDRISNEIYAVLPFFKNVERQQAKDFAGTRADTKERYILDDVEYPIARLRVHYINSVIANELANTDHGVQLRESSNIKCTYCPYGDSCAFKSEVKAL